MRRQEESQARCPRGMRRPGPVAAGSDVVTPRGLPAPAMAAAPLGVPGRGTGRRLVLEVTGAGCACVPRAELCGAGVEGGPPLAVIAHGAAESSTVLTGHETNEEAGFLMTNPVTRESCLLLIPVRIYRSRVLRKHRTIIRPSSPCVHQLRAQTAPHMYTLDCGLAYS